MTNKIPHITRIS